MLEIAEQPTLGFMQTWSLKLSEKRKATVPQEDFGAATNLVWKARVDQESCQWNLNFQNWHLKVQLLWIIGR